jgi:predicted amidophosphoribosyltransferase
MGMFDYVDYEGPCPYCGAKLTGFQSKDGPCELTTLPFQQVQNFYHSCPECKRWVEYQRAVPPAGSIHDYDLLDI